MKKYKTFYMSRINRILKYQVYLLALILVAVGCQKMDRPELGNYLKDPANPGGHLKLYMAFDGDELDSMRAMFGTPSNTSYVAGINKQALKGSTTGFVSYPSPGQAANLTSFSVSLWINTTKHDGGAQGVFMIPRTDDFWGNMFMLIEGNNSATDNTMLVKFHFGGQWVEFSGANRLPDMYGAWKHLVFTYDAATSKFSTYLNGVKVNLPASMSDRTLNGAPLGSNFSFKNVSKFIINGYQQDLGSPWAAPETWMLNYTGLLDQFRIYDKALSAAEVTELYNTKS
jgi:concanavalin A-like lectin/glucanase superfamily protein